MKPRVFYPANENFPLGELFTRDWQKGVTLRGEGIETVASHNQRWIDLCRAEAERYAMFRATFTGEDLRFHCSREVGLPHHSNAWGALISYLVKRGVIEPTGEYRPMRDENSHARKTAVYRKCL